MELVEAAHARGLKVMGDLTANHSGDAHEWFRQALAEPDSEQAGYYYFNDDHTGYEAWYGVPSLPQTQLDVGGAQKRGSSWLTTLP